MKNEQKIYKNEFGSFYSQFGFSQKETKPPSKQQTSKKPSKDKFYHSKRGTHDNYRMNNTKQSRHVQRRVNKDTQKKVMLNSYSESRTDSDNEDDINQLDNNICIKGNCSCRPKTINVISRDQEFILDTLRKVEDEKTKQNLYEKINPYNLNDILSRFDQQSPKEVSIKELHEEVKQHKNEIKELRQFISIGLSDLQDQINRIGNQENHMDIPESSQVNDNETDTFLNTVRAAENCLQEGLVPIPLCEESSMSLFGADSKRFTTKYKLTDVHIRNHDVCIKQTFILVKNLNEKALLGIPFLSSIYPMWVDNQGIRTKLCDKEILFEFANPLRQHVIRLPRAQVSPKKILMRIDDSTSYLPPCKHVFTRLKHKSSQKGFLGISEPLSSSRIIPLRPLKYNVSIEKHKKNGYNFIHFGMIQVAAKPLTRLGLNTAIVMCLRDNRHLEYRDSIIGAVQAGLNDGPVYFQCYPNFTVRIRDADILDSVVLHIKTHGFKIKPGNSPVSIITRFAYKSMNTSVGSGALCTSPKGETTYFHSDMLDKTGLLQIFRHSSSPRVSFMNLLELQALPSRLEPLGKKKDPAQKS
ncbi:hypothetical protein AAG906_026091 [Vitis piasezkii]